MTNIRYEKNIMFFCHHATSSYLLKQAELQLDFLLPRCLWIVEQWYIYLSSNSSCPVKWTTWSLVAMDTFICFFTCYALVHAAIFPPNIPDEYIIIIAGFSSLSQLPPWSPRSPPQIISTWLMTDWLLHDDYHNHQHHHHHHRHHRHQKAHNQLTWSPGWRCQGWSSGWARPAPHCEAWRISKISICPRLLNTSYLKTNFALF